MSRLLGQCRWPHGRFGRFLAREMNRAHAPMTGWILSDIPLCGARRILDLGCGGGGAIKRLAALAPEAEIHGVDHSADSARVAARTLGDLLVHRRAFVSLGAVSDLPYGGEHFDLALAVESHYFWPDLPGDLLEVRRVLTTGGRLVIGGAVYSGGRRESLNLRLAKAGAMSCLSLSELGDAFAAAGFVDVAVRENARKGWFCVAGVNPAERGSGFGDVV